MPIYEFRCQDCQALFEAIVPSASRIYEVVCKKCGSKKIKKNISPFCSRSSAGSAGSSSGALGGCSPRGGFS